jgi:hypothetical protein
MKKRRKRKAVKGGLGVGLRTEVLRGLIGELGQVRNYEPLVHKGKGKYEGGILGFITGLRLSARVAYYIREQLSETDYRISWGHLIDEQERSCSPECDIIIHKKGHIRKWNGFRKSIMNFKFVRARRAVAVVSCKSTLKSIDVDHPKNLKKFGIKNVFLFAESCKKGSYARLAKAARKAGYKGLWCLYFKDADGSTTIDDTMHIAFIESVKRAISR